jgi:hypothetical protein
MDVGEPGVVISVGACKAAQREGVCKLPRRAERARSTAVFSRQQSESESFCLSSHIMSLFSVTRCLCLSMSARARVCIYYATALQTESFCLRCISLCKSLLPLSICAHARMCGYV